MKRFLGRVSEWSVTHPAQTIAGVVSLVAIVGALALIELSPDAGTDKLVDNGSSAFKGTQELHKRFGDDAIVILAKGDLRDLVLTDNLGKLLALEGCLSGKAPAGAPVPAEVCSRISALDATQVVFGPATFLNQAATQASAYIKAQFKQTQAAATSAARQAAVAAAKAGLTLLQQQAAATQAQQAVISDTLAKFQDIAIKIGDFGSPSLDDPRFVSAIVFDSRQPSGTPKSRFGYLFPSNEGALISVRLKPNLPDDARREAIGLIREAVSTDAFKLKDGSYEVSGIPVVVQGLADELGGEILLLLGVALAIMALTLFAVFGPPMWQLPLFVALGGAAFAFGLLSIVGGTLTMASVAVLPVVIGLGVDYAIQLQARFREALEGGHRPAAAAVTAAVQGGPVIGTAALATAVGFLALVLSPIPMVREFGVALVAGIIAALAVALTAGLAALSLSESRRPGRGPRRVPRPIVNRRFAAAAGSAASAGQRLVLLGRGARGRMAAAGRTALAAGIETPGRVLIVASVLAVTGWVAGTGTKVVSDIRELVPGDLPALQSVDELQRVTGVSGELDVMVSGADVTTEAAVNWMRDFKERVLSQHGFTGEFPSCRAEGTDLCPGPALPDLFDSGGPPTSQRIQSVLAAIPSYFSQAILSRPETGDQVANIAFLIPVMPLDQQEALIDDIRSELDPPPGISAEVVGLPVLAADANAELSGSRYLLTLVGLVAVALVLLAVYRSASRALVPLIPIALATGWSALVLEAVGIPLNPMSATLGALVIAVATEFSVLLSARYHEERASGRTIGEALRFTYTRTGAAVLASGITSIAGFGVLAFSGITMLRDFGLVTVVDLSVSLAGVMLVLPAALVWAEGGFQPLPSMRRSWRTSPPDLTASSAGGDGG